MRFCVQNKSHECNVTNIGFTPYVYLFYITFCIRIFFYCPFSLCFLYSSFFLIKYENIFFALPLLRLARLGFYFVSFVPRSVLILVLFQLFDTIFFSFFFALWLVYSLANEENVWCVKYAKFNWLFVFVPIPITMQFII